MGNKVVNSTYWDDDSIQELEPREKLIYLCLLTCQDVNMLGIYHITRSKISFYTGYSLSDVKESLSLLEQHGRIKMNCEYCIVLNYLKHQNVTSPKIRKGILNLFNGLPQSIQELAMGIDYIKQTIQEFTQGYAEYLESKKSDVEQIDVLNNTPPEIPITPTPAKIPAKHQEIIDYWNAKKITNHPKMTGDIKKGIEKRLKEYTPEQIKQAIDNYKKAITSDPFWINRATEWTLDLFLSRQGGMPKFLTWEPGKGTGKQYTEPETKIF